jgi:pimeloyl-ACP methyl ester carboxylesterase
MDTLSGGFVNTAQCRFFYVEAGAGPAVLLLHGGGATHHEWSRLLPSLARGHRVIAPDLPGFGQTGRPREGYVRTTLARAIVELMKALGEERLAVVGHGLGGFLAVELGAAWPYTVSRLALISPVVGGLDGSARATTVDEAMAERQLYGDGSIAHAVQASQHFMRAAEARQWYADSLSAHAGQSDPAAVRELLVNAGQVNDGLMLRAFRCPTLVVRPETDSTFSRARAERIAQLIPLGRLVELAALGHFAHVERPEAVADVLLPFLDAR